MATHLVFRLAQYSIIIPQYKYGELSQLSRFGDIRPSVPNHGWYDAVSRLCRGPHDTCRLDRLTSLSYYSLSLYVCLLICLFVCLSVCLVVSIFLSFFLSLYLSVSLSLSLSLSLFFALPLFILSYWRV